MTTSILARIWKYEKTIILMAIAIYLLVAATYGTVTAAYGGCFP